MSMKTQSVFNYVVTENKEVKDAESGLVVKLRKEILANGTVAAYSENSAKVLATEEALKAAPKADREEIEVLVRPFLG